MRYLVWKIALKASRPLPMIARATLVNFIATVGR